MTVGVKGDSQETHFVAVLGFCTRQLWHLIVSALAAIAHRELPPLGAACACVIVAEAVG